MATPSVVGKEKELFEFMKQEGYPIFHQSNLFLKDVEYGIRDFYRTRTKKDIGTRESKRLAAELLKYLEANGHLRLLSEHTWLLNMPEFLNKPKETPAAEPAPAA